MNSLPAPLGPLLPDCPSPPPVQPGTRQPVWGPWATLWLGLAVALVFVAGQMLPVAAGFWAPSWWGPQGTARPALPQIAADGDVLAAATVTGGALGLVLIAVLALARGSSPARYLELRGFAWWHLPLWLVATLGAGVVQTLLAPLFQQEPIPEFMVDTFRSTDHPLLLALGIALVAPLFEECFFRGFLHAGWRRSRCGVPLSILLTTLLWTGIHMQYGWFEKSWIFSFGLLLCLAREWSGSLWPPIAMHVLNNGLSLVATAMELE